MIACDAAEKITSVLRESEEKRHVLMQNEIYNLKYVIADALEQSGAMHLQPIMPNRFFLIILQS